MPGCLRHKQCDDVSACGLFNPCRPGALFNLLGQGLLGLKTSFILCIVELEPSIFDVLGQLLWDIQQSNEFLL